MIRNMHISRMTHPYSFHVAVADEDMVTAVGWSANNELMSVGDDHVIQRWAMDGEPQGKVRICTQRSSQDDTTFVM